MPIINPNTSEQLDMTPMAPGPRRAHIDAVEVTKSKKGNPMLVLDLTVQDGDQERPRKDWVVTEGPGSGKFDQLLRACGFEKEAEEFKAGIPNQFDTDLLVGQDVTVQIDQSLGTDQKIRDGIDAYLRA